MEHKCRWITPFVKQCFVTTGVAINFAQQGLVSGFCSNLLPQLRAPGADIQIDDVAASWIASLPAASSVPMYFIMPTLMGKYGRKVASISSVASLTFAWMIIATATDLPTVFIGRILQGAAAGIVTSLAVVQIGEYTSPIYRGGFLSLLSLILATGTHVSHTIGSYTNWQTTALIFGIVSFLDLLIVIYSPESPSWLICKERYEEGSKAFRWLRGDGEEEELSKMIEADIALRDSQEEYESNADFKKIVYHLFDVIKQREFYKPNFMAAPLYVMIYATGVIILASYAVDVCDTLIGEGTDIPLVILSADSLRLIANVFAIYLIKKFKRRTMLITTVGVNVFALLASAGYAFAVSRDMISVNAVLGILLYHLHLLSIGLGSLPVPVIITGEIFPLKYRSMASVIGNFIGAIIFFITIKTWPLASATIGLHGSYLIYGFVLCSCLIICLIYLPETKDRTLQEIEHEFVGRQHSQRSLQEAADPLTRHNINDL